MKNKHLGKLKPRYSFLLNPYSDVRLSKCPRCERPTHLRKFALFIHIEDWGPIILGKTCRYCTPCELIMAHCNELEPELASGPTQFVPTTPGSGYFVVGTVELKTWREGIQNTGTPMGDILEHMADFKKYLDLHVEPGGWRPTNESRKG